MPKGSKVSRCVKRLKRQGKSKSSAIRICQDSTGQSYQSGKKLAKGGVVGRTDKRRTNVYNKNSTSKRRSRRK